MKSLFLSLIFFAADGIRRFKKQLKTKPDFGDVSKPNEWSAALVYLSLHPFRTI
jgi:hypothetical protein